MNGSQTDGRMRELLDDLRSADPPPAAVRAVRQVAAEHAHTRMVADNSHRGWYRWVTRPVGLALLGLVITGAATAAVTGNLGFSGLSGFATSDDTSAPVIRGLVTLLDEQQGANTPVRTGTIRRDNINVGIAVSDHRVCFATPGQQSLPIPDARHGRPDSTRALPPGSGTSRANEARRAPLNVGCVAISDLDERLPVVAGHDAQDHWVVAIVPDGVRDVRATTADGRTVDLSPERNIATAAGPTPFTAITWTTVDGASVDQRIIPK